VTLWSGTVTQGACRPSAVPGLVDIGIRVGLRLGMLEFAFRGDRTRRVNGQ